MVTPAKDHSSSIALAKAAKPTTLVVAPNVIAVSAPKPIPAPAPPPLPQTPIAPSVHSTPPAPSIPAFAAVPSAASFPSVLAAPPPSLASTHSPSTVSATSRVIHATPVAADVKPHRLAARVVDASAASSHAQPAV